MMRLLSWHGLQFALIWLTGVFLYRLLNNSYLNDMAKFPIKNPNYMDYFMSVLTMPLLLFLVFTTSLSISFIGRFYSKKLGDLQLRLPLLREGIFRLKPKSEKYFFREFWMALLLVPVIYYSFRILESIAIKELQFKYESDIVVWAISILFFVTYGILLINIFIDKLEFREFGIIHGFYAIKWEKVIDYQLIGSGNTYLEILGIKSKSPEGLAVLKIRYNDLMTINNIFIQENFRSDIEKILASKLPQLPLENSLDTLLIPQSFWELSLEPSPSIINNKGIFYNNLIISWTTISICEWRELKDYNSLMSWFFRLNNRKNYNVLRVKHINKQRSQWIEIPVPGSLVTQAHELLVKYLPDHVQINQPPNF